MKISSPNLWPVSSIYFTSEKHTFPKLFIMDKFKQTQWKWEGGQTAHLLVSAGLSHWPSPAAIPWGCILPLFGRQQRPRAGHTNAKASSLSENRGCRTNGSCQQKLWREKRVHSGILGTFRACWEHAEYAGSPRGKLRELGYAGISWGKLGALGVVRGGLGWPGMLDTVPLSHGEGAEEREHAGQETEETEAGRQLLDQPERERELRRLLQAWLPACPREARASPPERFWWPCFDRRRLLKR